MVGEGKPLLSFVDLESLKMPTAQLISAYFLYRQEERWHDRADERKAQASKAGQARQITNANKSREQREMVKARTDQGLQQHWANLSAAQRTLRVKNQSDDKRKYNASLDPDDRAAITQRQLKSRKENDAQRAPEEVYLRNQEHLWTIGWSFASRHWDPMLRIDALEREGEYQALTQVAHEDVCDSFWKGGHNPARMSRDQLHSAVSKRVSIIKANVRGNGSYGEIPKGWQVPVDFSLNKRSWLSTVNPSSVPDPALQQGGTAC